ncbi:MAG TPA: DUF190 domain-containing protein [Mucilaginibacter sp.]|nr:DUF190 domain-containing protein [Mucilaginibacter sp.]
MTTPEIIEKPLGKLQIFIKPKDKVKGSSLIGRLTSKQLYREIVRYAKEDQLLNASVYQTHSGYSLDDDISVRHAELDNSGLALCIELIDAKSRLENFCKKHAVLLKGKMIVFKAVEFWEIR